jgi:hypothetical protein
MFIFTNNNRHVQWFYFIHILSYCFILRKTVRIPKGDDIYKLIIPHTTPQKLFITGTILILILRYTHIGVTLCLYK